MESQAGEPLLDAASGRARSRRATTWSRSRSTRRSRPSKTSRSRKRSTSSTCGSAASASRSSGDATCTSPPGSCCRGDSTSTPMRAIRSWSITGTSRPTSAAGERRRPTRRSSPTTARDSTSRGYNRIQQEHAWQFYKDWTGKGFPRVLLDRDPARDAVLRRLLRRQLGQQRSVRRRDSARADPGDRASLPRNRAGWARFTYGGSTGGWEAMAVQMFYPDEYNGAWVACPDPIDFRAYTVVNIYEDTNAYYQRRAVQARAAPGTAQLPRPRLDDARAVQSSRARARHAAADPAISGTSGNRCTHRSARTDIRSRSGTSSPA